MTTTTKLIGAFALGAIAAIAVIKLLESEGGEELMEKVKEKAHSTAEGIKEKIQQLETELADLIHPQKEESTSIKA